MLIHYVQLKKRRRHNGATAASTVTLISQIHDRASPNLVGGTAGSEEPVRCAEYDQIRPDQREAERAHPNVRLPYR